MSRLVHITDVHFGGEDRVAVEAATAFILDDPPDLVVVTGDVTLCGRPREFEAAAAWLERLPNPLVVTPGNHDTPYLNIPLRAFTPFDRYRRWIGPTRGCGATLPDVVVRLGHVDVQQPDVAASLDAIPEGTPVVIVPLLLSAGYHVRVDLIEQIED